jgi:hypothetical protein
VHYTSLSIFLKILFYPVWWSLNSNKKSQKVGKKSGSSTTVLNLSKEASAPSLARWLVWDSAP